jgi:arsenite methyltransferase
MINEKPEAIRNSVSKSYTKAVESSGGCCSGETVPKGVAAQLAGYTREEMLTLPDDAVANSFGCGNPLAFAGVKEGQVVLDLGSGAGIDILLAAKIVGPGGKAIGVDMTDAMIERARDNAAAAGLENVDVRKGLIEELPVESDSVDWVISNCVINLSPEKDRVFAEIARVLKPGGQIAVSDIVVEGLPDWVMQSAAMYSSCIAGAISEEAYLEGLHAAGLVDVEVKDRLVYEASQILALAASELDEGASAAACCSGAVTDHPLAKQMAESVTGKIWSAKFAARKP